MNDYEAKVAARKERLENRADRLRQESDAAFKRADSMASCIPMGQPIMVGHHSEKRDRAFRKRIHNAMDKGCALSDEAAKTATKAAAVGTGGISSDDPEAVAKLKAELATLEATQARMVAANKAIRTHAKAGKDAQIAALITLGYSDARASSLVEPDFCGRIGFPDYATANNNGNMLRIRERIKTLEQHHVEAETTPEQEIDCGAYALLNNLADNRLQVIFPGKPNEAVRSIMKRNGFRWSPTSGAWQRFPNAYAFQMLTREDGDMRRAITAAS